MKREPSPPKAAVVPNVVGAIGLRHPVDGPLDRDGSTWTLDAFTTRKLLDGSIRRKEVAVAPAKAQAPAEPAEAGAVGPPAPGKTKG